MMRLTHTYACWDMKQWCLSVVGARVALLGGDHHGMRPHRLLAVSYYAAAPISLSVVISDEASLRQLFLREKSCPFLVALFARVKF